MRLFLSADGKSGFAIKDGNITSIYNHRDTPGTKAGLLRLAIEEGGTRIQAVDIMSPDIYGQNGFRAVARTKAGEVRARGGPDSDVFAKFHDGHPDTVYMVYDPAHEHPYKPGDGKLVKTHEEAVALQKKALEDIHQRPLEQRSATVKGSYNPATRVIQLVRGKADFSTGLHEVAHDFYDFAHKHPEYESAISAAYGHLPYRQAQEAFARHYEAYLRSGKAPVRTLQPLFEAARQWMAKIYRQWRHGETPADIHAMFDRIYANPSQETRRLIKEFENFTPPTRPPVPRPRVPYSNQEDERKKAMQRQSPNKLSANPERSLQAASRTAGFTPQR